MQIISEKLTEKFIERHIIDSSKKEIYIEGLNLILSDIINFSLILIIGALTKSFILSLLYLIVFWNVRKFSGGFHAKTYMVCRTATIGTYLLIWLLYSVLNSYHIVCVIICSIIALATMLLFAPIRHPNKELTLGEIKANKLFSVIATLFFIVISVILIIIGYKEGLFISLTLFAITILMYVGMFTNRNLLSKVNR